MHGRQALDSPGLETAVVNAFRRSFAGKHSIHRVLPPWPQPGHRISSATAPAGDGVEPLRLFTEHAVGIHGACGQEQVRMEISIIAIT